MNRSLVWRTIQNSTWLLGGFGMLGVAFFLWIGVQIHQRIVIEKPPQDDVPVEPEKVKFSPTLGMMTDIVPVLDLTQSSTQSSHVAEFRGADFIKSQSDRWFLQIMDVTQEEVIKSYLANRTDRKQFAYFRYVEPQQPERYLLTYGSFNSVTQALEASKKVSFDLPSSIKIQPQRFSSLKKFVKDDVGAEVKITNLSGSNKIYQVKLRAVPVPVETPAVTDPVSSPGSDSPSIEPTDLTNNAQAGNTSISANNSIAPNRPGNTTVPTSSGLTANRATNNGAAGSVANAVNSTTSANPANSNTINNGAGNPNTVRSVPVTPNRSTSTSQASAPATESPAPIVDPFN
ncbi:hypothetical protein ACF3NA_00875 [Alkanindiges sp. WGS2144]|uniref:hypothetical protein n=1 Tax=Alkanindiges sp. WGS2144 TaxID=3366808 RepID=UPI0037530362